MYIPNLAMDVALILAKVMVQHHPDVPEEVFPLNGVTVGAGEDEEILITYVRRPKKDDTLPRQRAAQ